MCATVAWILVGCAGSPEEAERGRDSTLRAELLELYEEDQQAREGFGAAAAAQDTVFMKRLMAGDSVRSTRLHEILTATGWPTVAQVDSDGVHAAWMLLQHSPSVEMQF